ncbi:asparagine synthetase B family protein [Tuwongella immobilis]|uniref:asparagine synthase (glutamine-hydrolyzing) n=1 Tax=Tuwongella immobilis TaxID=692036 RepID=A0A6C2YQQ4_9BACT|nr:asparagine synthetase B family protein [Tuwongella immobilis]VIP03489.1 asparagine synthase : Asparagine synthetase OS=Hyalangium minutum GN=DB31_6148 PE=4 SV=1: Asn_synthase [Tuwongella immobilis]VTS04347.1 asparagine synthase : Asparagine synthetase OS=Hyalangium minutum GN=DB31_6148 PE=4 SV=1: Asn_synthase [Tuwongella immobilis]
MADLEFPTVQLEPGTLRTPALRSRIVPGIGIDAAPLQVDCDHCTIHGRPLVSQHDWQEVLSSGQLGAVTGAFAIVWRHKGETWLARDALGERTLYFHHAPDGVIAGSTIRDLLQSANVPRQLSIDAIATYLIDAYLPGRLTMIAGIEEVLPGELVRIPANGPIARTQIWEIPPEPREFSSESTQVLELRRSLDQAIRRCLPDDCSLPIAASLSGGLDSSLVLGLACRARPGEIASYSISFGTQYANELPFSSLMAAHCGSRHTIVEFTPESIADGIAPTMAALSDPIGDPLTVPNALLFRYVSATSSVMLNGEGGDPCFGGPKNLPMVLSELYGPPTIRHKIQSYFRSHLKCFDDLPAMLHSRIRDRYSQERLEASLLPHFENPRYQTLITRLQAMNIQLKGGHHILPKVDALSRMSGMLARSPLFDRDVVEMSFRIPAQGKLHGSVEKWRLKQAVSDVVPEAIRKRPKSGMLVPVEGWFQGPLLPIAKQWLLDGLAKRDIIDRTYLERLLSHQLGGPRPRHGVKIWLLVALEAWIQTHLGDGPISVV